MRARITYRLIRPLNRFPRIPAARASATEMARESESERAWLPLAGPPVERQAAGPGVPEDGAPAWPLRAWAEPEAWEPWAAAVLGLVWAP